MDLNYTKGYMMLLDKQQEELKTLQVNANLWLDDEVITLDEYLEIFDYIDQSKQRLNELYL